MASEEQFNREENFSNCLGLLKEGLSGASSFKS